MRTRVISKSRRNPDKFYSKWNKLDSKKQFFLYSSVSFYKLKMGFADVLK